LDPKIQIELLQEMFRLIYEKAEFGKLVIENSKQGLNEKGLIQKIVEIHGDWKIPEEWQIIRNFMAYKLMTDFSNLK
jgi:hypothetical protein